MKYPKTPSARVAACERARELVLLEGYLLDVKDWDGWLELFAEGAVYWVPSWKSDEEVTDNPDTELSLIYYPNRTGLEDRIYRIRTNRSLASTPLPRTTHITHAGRTTVLADGRIEVESNWVVYVHRLEKTHFFFGRQNHIFQTDSDDLKIVWRKSIVNNDTIPDVLDIYCI